MRKCTLIKRDQQSGQWQLVQTIPTPAGADDLIFADTIEGAGKAGSTDKFVMVSERDSLTNKSPQVHVYRIGPNGIMPVNGLEPIQTVQSAIPADPDCPFGPNGLFGSDIDASNGIAVIAEPCATIDGVPSAGAVNVYKIDNSGNNMPLSLVDVVPGEPLLPFLTFGGGNIYLNNQTMTTDGDIYLAGSIFAAFFYGIQEVMPVFKRDSMDQFEFLQNIDDIPSAPSGFGYYGWSVRLIGNDELAITVTDDFDISGQVHLYKLEGF